MHKGLMGLDQRRMERQSGFAQVYFPGEPLPSMEEAVSVTDTSSSSQPAAESEPWCWTLAVGKLAEMPVLTDTQKAERAELMGLLFPLLQRAEELEREVLNATREQIEGAWHEIRPLCRAALNKLTNLQNKLRNAEIRADNAEFERHSAFQNLQQAQSERLPRYFSNEEAAARERRIDSARRQAKEAEREQVDAMHQRAFIGGEFEDAQKEMNRLGQEEARLRGLLTGKRGFDPELGLAR